APSGAPVVGAKVLTNVGRMKGLSEGRQELFPHPLTPGAERTAYTDIHGEYHLDGVPPRWEPKLLVSHADYALAIAAVASGPVCRVTQVPSITMHAGGGLHVTVRARDDRRPVPGVDVVCRPVIGPEEWERRATTDRAGEVRLADILPGAWRVATFSERH